MLVRGSGGLKVREESVVIVTRGSPVEISGLA